VKGPRLLFYDWNDGIFVRNFLANLPREIFWNESGTLCIILCEETSCLSWTNALRAHSKAASHRGRR